VPKVIAELPEKTVAKLAKQPGKYAVGGCRGLLLRVTDTGSASWVLRIKLRDGRRIDRGLGGYGEVSLSEAREVGRELRKKLWESPRIDPTLERKSAIAHARAEQEAASRAAKFTFGQDAEDLHGTKAQEFKNAKHAAQWISSLREYAKAIWDKPVSEVNRDDVLGVLKPIWQTKTETATRVRQRIESVLAFAAVIGHRSESADNPARWQGGLQHLLPKPGKLKKVKHHAALPWKQLPAFVKELAKREGVAARALELAILTAARSGEVRLAAWSEIDLAAKLWTIPAERMKAGKAHRVPLSAAAMKLLRELEKTRKEGAALVFPADSGKPLSDMALLAVCQRMNVEAVPHGFRSSFKDWARTKSEHLDEVSELALAHVSSDATRAAYARDELLEQRAALMRDWARFLATE
jgi:integrase